MTKGYFVEELEESKKYKNIPYLSKKQFELIEEDYPIIGSTTLKKIKDDSKNPTLIYEEQKYRIKKRIFGYTKGFIILENEECVKLKKRIPFIFILLFIFLLWLLLFSHFYKPIEQEVPKIEEPPVIDKIDVPDAPSTPSEPEKDHGNIVPSKPLKRKYVINYHSNYDESFKTIEYESDKEYSLLKNPFSKKGSTFIGWSLTKDGEVKYLDEETIANLSSENNKIDLYAIWKINEYEISFNDYDGTIIQNYKLNYDSTIKYPENPKREGYIFKSWDKDISKVEQDEKITAIYEIDNYIITLNPNGGILEDNTKNYNVESSDIILPSPTKKGYTFVGWSGTEITDKELEVVIPEGSVGNREYTANWEANEYKVSLNTDGGEVSKEHLLIKYDSSYEGLPIPEKSGYNFDGWYYEEELITNETLMTKDFEHELVAKWEITDYHITYDLDGGSLENLVITYNVGKEDFAISNPIKKGYVFVGWNINGNSNLEKNLIIKQGTTRDINLKANYQPISYSIVYNANGGTGKMEDTIVNYDQEINLKPNSYEYIGKKFIGWSLSKTSNVIFKDQDLISNLSSINDSKITLYANWETIYYNVTYYDWNNEIVKEEKIAYNEESVPPTLYRRGYTFESWDKSNFLISSDTTYHPIFTRNNYTIQYDLNKDTSNDLVAIDYNIESSDITLPTPTKEGYTFEGWKDLRTFDVALNVVIPKGSIGNKRYIAIWKSNKYLVSFNANGGSMNDIPFEVSYNSLYGLLPSTTKRGYTFNGWYYQNDLVTEDTVMAKNYNHQLDAHWEAINYTIDYNLNGGTLSNSISQYNIESSNIKLPVPTRNGYTFIGWTGTGLTEKTMEVVIESGSIGNRKYTANWEVNKYSISYNLNGGNVSNLLYEYTVETDTFKLPDVEKLGYTFIGWTGANGNTPSKDVSITKGTTGNKEYIANFQINTYTITYNTSMSSLPTNPTSYTVESNSFTLNNPSKYGEFSFVGWSGTGINGRVGSLTIPKGSVGNRDYTANWYDDTPPTITGFTVKVVGRNSKGGHDIDISIDAYDNGVGIDRFETWLVPYKNGSGAGREVGATRHLGNVLYLDDPEGRTLCGYAIDRNGNEAEACYTVYD